VVVGGEENIHKKYGEKLMGIVEKARKRNASWTINCSLKRPLDKRERRVNGKVEEMGFDKEATLKVPRRSTWLWY